LSRYARVYQWAERVPASVAAKLAGVRTDSSFFITSMNSTAGSVIDICGTSARRQELDDDALPTYMTSA